MAPTSGNLAMSDTLRSLLTPALQDRGINETAPAVDRFHSRFPRSSANGCQIGSPPERFLRFRPSDTRQSAGSERCLPITTAVHQPVALTGLAGPHCLRRSIQQQWQTGLVDSTPRHRRGRRDGVPGSATVPAISAHWTANGRHEPDRDVPNGYVATILRPTGRMMKTPRDKYMNDPEYNHLVRFLEELIERARFTPSEMREACVLACINYEMRHVRDMNIDPRVEGAMKIMDDFMSRPPKRK